MTDDRGAPTHDLSQGLESLRWGDDEAAVRRAHPRGWLTVPTRGKDAQSGELIVLPPSMVIDDFLGVPGASVQALVGFHDGVVVGVDLFPRGVYQQLPTRTLLLRALATLCVRLGIGPCPQTDGEHRIEHAGAYIDVFVTQNDFIVSVYAPHTEELGRRTPSHRAYRRLQAQRGKR